VLHGGANLALLPPPPPTAFDGITHLLLQNEVSLASTVAYLAVARGRRVTTIFNPSPMPSPKDLLAFPWSTLDWLIVNESEAVELLRALGTPNSGLASSGLTGENMLAPSIITAYSVIARLHAHAYFAPTTRIVCTLGHLGVVALDPNLTNPVYVPAIELQGNVRDTTGAGDCFTGYFVAGLMRLEDEGRQMDEVTFRQILERCVKVRLNIQPKQSKLVTQHLFRRLVCQ
jgi:ribokinase